MLSRVSAPPQPLPSIAHHVSLINYSYRLAVVLYRLPRSRALVLCLRGLASLLCLTSFFSLVAGVHRNIPARYVMPRRSAPVTQLVALTCHLHFLVPYSPSPIAYLVATPCCLMWLSWYLVPTVAYLLPLISQPLSDIFYLRSLTSPFPYPSPYLLYSCAMSHPLLLLISQLAPVAYLAYRIPRSDALSPQIFELVPRTYNRLCITLSHTVCRISLISAHSCRLFYIPARIFYFWM